MTQRYGPGRQKLGLLLEVAASHFSVAQCQSRTVSSMFFYGDRVRCRADTFSTTIQTPCSLLKIGHPLQASQKPVDLLACQLWTRERP